MIAAFLTTVLAAPASAAPALTVGLYAPYGVQPGVRISAELPVGSGFFVRPHLAAFSRPGNHVSGMVGTDLGYRIASARSSHALSLGVGYLASSQITAISIDLADGSHTPQRELRHFAVPALTHEYARSRWYIRTSLGRTMSPQHANAGFYAVEVGLRFGGVQ